MPKKDTALKIIPLGGLDGIGKNMTCFEYGQDMVLVDAGLMFHDESQPGIDLIQAISAIFSNYPDLHCEIIAASVRGPIHVTDCALAGADIATVPYKVIEQMTKHPLTDAGIEKFRADYVKVFGE